MYEYVNKGSSPALESKNPHRAMGVRSGLQHYTITFSELPSRTHGNLRLIYFSQTDDNVQSVLGISDPFPVRRKD